MADTFQYGIGKVVSFPSAAVGVSVTPNNTAWANSSWTEVIASAATDYYLIGLVVHTVGLARQIEVDVGTGGAGSETVKTTFRAQFGSTTAYSHPSFIPHVIAGDYIASGDRVAVRMRHNSTGTTAFTFGLRLMEKPLSAGNMLTTSVAQAIYPPAANSISVPGAVAFANGAWTTIVASTASAIVIPALVLFGPAASMAYEADLGTGGSGSETVISTIRGVGESTLAGGPAVIALPNPLDNVGNGVRLAMRQRQDNAGPSTFPLAVAVMYLPKPI